MNPVSHPKSLPLFQVKKVALSSDPPFSKIVDYYFNKAAPFAEDAINKTVKAKMTKDLRERLVSVSFTVFTVLGSFLFVVVLVVFELFVCPGEIFISFTEPHVKC